MKRSLEISSKGKDGIFIKDIIHPSMLKNRSDMLKGIGDLPDSMAIHIKNLLLIIFTIKQEN